MDDLLISDMGNWQNSGAIFWDRNRLRKGVDEFRLVRVKFVVFVKSPSKDDQ